MKCRSKLVSKCIYLYGVLLVYLCFIKQLHAENLFESVGIPQNVTVATIQEKHDDTHNLLRLNISWAPSNEENRPLSYSIVVTSAVSEKDIKSRKCPYGSIYYTTQDENELSVLLPQNKFSSSLPELYVFPNCTYEIEISANPRNNFTKKAQVIYTVPDCINYECTCSNALYSLPTPVVDVIFELKENIIIKWKINSNISNIHSFTISLGIPLLTSKSGNPVYNITNIGNASSICTTFSWDSYVNGLYVQLHPSYKIIVTANDKHGCPGGEGFYIIPSTYFEETTSYKLTWLIFGILISITLIVAIIKFLVSYQKKKYSFIPTTELSIRANDIHVIPKNKSEWTENILKKRNVLYIEQPTEGKIYKDIDSDTEVPDKSVSLICELGKGQFGKVYLGNLNDYNETFVAVKMSHYSNVTSELEARSQLLEEIEMMKLAGPHPHLIRLIGYCVLPDKPISIILEYMEGGDLLAYLHSRRRNREYSNSSQRSINFERDTTSQQPTISESLYKTLSSHLSSISSFSESTRLSISYIKEVLFDTDNNKYASKYVNIQDITSENIVKSKGDISREEFIKFALDIAKGMCHLEQRGITHRDLAARNILLTSDLTLKISDFGLSRNGIYVMSTTPGTVRQLPIRWMSPEALRDREFSSKSDVWSYAIVLWEIATLGAFPYSNISDSELLRYVLHGEARLEQPDNIKNDLYEVMKSCWAIQPKNRPCFAELIMSFQILNEPSLSLCGTSNPCYSLISNSADNERM